MAERLTWEEIVSGYNCALDLLVEIPDAGLPVVDQKLDRVWRYIEQRAAEELALVLEDDESECEGCVRRARRAPEPKKRFWDTGPGEWVQAIGITAVIVASIFAGLATYDHLKAAQVVTYDKRDGSITTDVTAWRKAIGCADDDLLNFHTRVLGDGTVRATPYCVSQQYDGDVQ